MLPGNPFLAHSHIPHCGSLETFLPLLSQRNNCPFSFPKLPYKWGLIPSPSAFSRILFEKGSLLSCLEKWQDFFSPFHKYSHSLFSDAKGEKNFFLGYGCYPYFLFQLPTLPLSPCKPFGFCPLSEILSWSPKS